MNRSNYHMRYRQSVYRRRRIRALLITSGIVILALLLLFLLLGNLFFNKLQQTPEEPKQTEAVETEPPMPFESVRHVQAPFLSLSDSSSKIYSRLHTLREEGHTSVSIPLTDADGHLSYRSKVATDGNYDIQSDASLSLSDLIEDAHANGIYLCGTYVLRATEEEDALTRSVLLSESAAVIAEAFLAGMDDIVIIAPSLPTDGQAELIRFVENIKSFAPKAVIGLSLPDAEIASPDATRIDTLARSFDYLALPLGNEDAEDPVAFAEGRMSAMLYYLLRYQMRVLIPELSDASVQEDLITAVKNESIDNWMLVHLQ